MLQGKNMFLLNMKNDKAFPPSDRFLLIPLFLWRRLGSNIPIMLSKTPTLTLHSQRSALYLSTH